MRISRHLRFFAFHWKMCVLAVLLVFLMRLCLNQLILPSVLKGRQLPILAHVVMLVPLIDGIEIVWCNENEFDGYNLIFHGFSKNYSIYVSQSLEISGKGEFRRNHFRDYLPLPIPIKQDYVCME